MAVVGSADLPPAVVGACHPLGSVRAVTATAIPVDNMTTESLVRYDVESDGPDGTRSWSVVAKTLRPASASPVWAQIPPEHRASTAAELDWTVEPVAYRCGLADRLPPGVRMPALLHVEAGDDRVALWLEHAADAPVWDVDRYRATARALGRLAGAFPAGTAVPAGLRGRSFRTFFTGKVTHVDLPALADPAVWAHPAVAPHDDGALGPDLLDLAGRVPALLDALDRLPRALGHGDACPQNLLRAGAGADVVAIDWGFAGTMAIGFDLASLVAGRVETGALAPEDLPAVHDAALGGYLEGLADVGADVDPEAVAAGALGTSVIRSAFTCLPLERLAGPPDGVGAIVRARLDHSRFLLDRLAAVTGAGFLDPA
jgi:hypothetical protein